MKRFLLTVSHVVSGVAIGFLIGVVIVGLPFQILAERERPIENTSDVIAAALAFAFFVPFGVYMIWLVFCAAAAGVLASSCWGYLKEGMRKEDVLHVLGEPTLEGKKRSDGLGASKTTWYYRYRWFALRGYVEFGANDTVTDIQLPQGKPVERFPGEFHGW